MDINRLKITYQRNMMAGQAVACLLAAIAAAVVPSLSGPQKARSPHPAAVAVPAYRSLTSTTAAVGLSLRRDRDTFRLPFFAHIKIIPDESAVEVSGRTVRYATQSGPEGFDPVIDESAFPLTGAAEERYGVYAPEPYSDLWFVGERTPPAFSQEAKLLLDVEPEYPLVAKDDQRQGEVLVLVMVGTGGELKAFPVHRPDGRDTVCTVLLIREQPQGWFFFDAVKRVLPKWRFLPRIEEGRPVDGFLEITYHFCLGMDCTKLQIKPHERETP